MTSLRKLHSRLLAFWFRKHGIQIGRDPWLEAGVAMECSVREGRRGEIRVGHSAQILRGAHLYAWGGSIALHDEVFVGNHAVIYGHGGVVIGDRTLISMHCRILSSNHQFADVSRPIRSQPDELLPTHIGADVWLGAGVTVLGGVRIGDGCVVGAGAVVTKDLPPLSIAQGVPARVVGGR